MRIIIDTDGTFAGTKAELGGATIQNFTKFSFSLRIDENGVKRPPKLTVFFGDGKLPISLYGEDFSEMELSK